MRLLILGRNGQLGWALERRCAGLGEVIALGREALDLADAKAIRSAIADARPDAVLNAAAYTAVDRAETERAQAFAVNAEAPGVIAAACVERGALLVHYSTDYVFDGRKPGRYVESDPTGPINTYGASKLAGEQAIAAAGAAAAVLRTSWVYGDHGGNFAKTMLRLASERESLRVVADQQGAPTWAGRLADATGRLLELARASGDPVGWLTERRGIYHAAPGGRTDWADYARRVIRCASSLPQVAPRLRMDADAVESIPSAAYPTPAARPANSLLDSSRFERTFGYRFPEWSIDVEDFVRRVAPAMFARG